MLVAPAARPLAVDEIARRLPEHVSDRKAWATTIAWSLAENEIIADEHAVCAVVATIDQESGFVADPPVPGIAAIVRHALDEEAHAKLGPLGPMAVERLLGKHAPGRRRTFGERLSRARTEGDVDRLFRDMVAAFESEHPVLAEAAKIAGVFHASLDLEAQNPITTAGSMQVSVRFAEALAAERDIPEDGVRDALYTMDGGVYYGAARLLGYQAAYPDMTFRFADYNAGVYASRNAALQRQLSRLVGRALAADGDFLRYDRRGEPSDAESDSWRVLVAFRARFAPELSEARMRRDVAREKEASFEHTRTYATIKRVYERRYGAPVYAVMPNVTIRSVKLRGTRSSEWFARSVGARYERCLAR